MRWSKHDRFCDRPLEENRFYSARSAIQSIRCLAEHRAGEVTHAAFA